jgi:hypothetical protein
MFYLCKLAKLRLKPTSAKVETWGAVRVKSNDNATDGRCLCQKQVSPIISTN